MKKFISICLIPAEKERIFLAKTIKKLAKEYQAHLFISHISLYAGIEMEENEITKLINPILDKLIAKPFFAKTNSLKYSDDFKKTLFIDFLINDEMKKIYEYLRNNFLKFADFTLHPHLSLIYKNNLPVEEKIKIIKNLTIPQSILFDRIDVITSPRHIVKEKDVLAWKTVYSKKFI